MCQLDPVVPTLSNVLADGSTHKVEHTPHLLQPILDQCPGQGKTAGTADLLHRQANLTPRFLQPMCLIRKDNTVN
jgi:hypothetical protein